MIAELDRTFINHEVNQCGSTYRSVLFPEPAIKLVNHRYKSRADRKPYVSHGSTRMTLSFSNPLMHHSQRTTKRFQCGVLSRKVHDSLTGQEGKANVGHPLATGRLQDTVSLSNKR